MMVHRVALVVLCGCGHPVNPADAIVSPAQPGEPLLTGVAFQCDVDDAEWRFYIRADAWAGGARLWMTRDGELTEVHRMDPQSAARDGSWDCHELRLDIAVDQRDASSGSSTRFRCTDLPELSFRLAVSDTDDEAWTDCRTWGAAPALLDGQAGAPSCDRVLTVADEPGELDDHTVLWGDVADCPG